MSVELSIVIPCLNEAETLASVIRGAHEGARRAGVESYEVVVADNGSTDGSQAIAGAEGARLVHVPVRGYGAALQGGIRAAQGRYVIMGDADGSYDLAAIGPFVEQLRAGYQLVMGTRLRGEIRPGAMPFLHRYLGNPLLTSLGNLFFGCGLSDFHSGLRGFDRQAVLALNLQTQGMEFASEMVIRATLEGLSRTEIPITLHPDGRSRPPHLHTWRDGWRHLRFMLLFSPRWLFLYPGIALVVAGLLLSLVLLAGPLRVGRVELDVHTLLAATAMGVVGVQLVMFAVFSRLYASRTGLLPRQRRLEELLEAFSLEAGLVAGLLVALAGVGLYVAGLAIWGRSGFGPLDAQRTLRVVIPGTGLLLVGMQVFFASFLISLLGIRGAGE